MEMIVKLPESFLSNKSRILVYHTIITDSPWPPIHTPRSKTESSTTSTSTTPISLLGAGKDNRTFLSDEVTPVWNHILYISKLNKVDQTNVQAGTKKDTLDSAWRNSPSWPLRENERPSQLRSEKSSPQCSHKRKQCDSKYQTGKHV